MNVQDPDTTAQTGTAQKLTQISYGWWCLAAAVLLLVGGGIWLAVAGWSSPSLDEVRLLLARGQWVAAEHTARGYLKSHPDDHGAVIMLARAIGGQGDVLESAKLLESIPADSLYRGRALYGAALAYMDAHWPRRAERDCLECLELTPPDPTAQAELKGAQQSCRVLLCGQYAIERRKRDFVKVAWDFYEAEPEADKHRALAMLPMYEFQLIQPQNALDALAQARGNDPQDLDTVRAIGLYQLEDADVEAALATLQTCVAKAPERMTMWEAWLRCVEAKGEKQDLKRAVEKAPAIMAQSAEFCAIKARTLRDENLQEAINWLEKAIKLEPYEPQYHHQLGEVLIASGKQSEGLEQSERNKELQESRSAYQDAYEEYRLWDAKAPEQKAEIAYRLGLAAEKMGRFREALGWFGAALQENPGHSLSAAARERLRVTQPEAMGNDE